MKNKPAVAPYLFAILPVLILFAHNADEVLPVRIILPLIITVSLTWIIMKLINLFLRDSGKSALITSPVMISLLIYGDLYEYIKTFIDGKVAVIGVSLILFLVILLYCLRILKTKTHSTVTAINSILNNVAILMIVINIAQIAISVKKAHEINTQEKLPQKTVLKEDLPDIYLIILDQYACLDEIKNVFGYDNSNFAQYLYSKNFYIAGKSKSMYKSTTLSLATSLNMGPPGFINSKKESENMDMMVASSLGMEDYQEKWLKKLVRNNKVIKLLKSNGYKYINFGSWYYGTSYNMRADRNFNCYGFRVRDEFMHLLIKQSILRVIFINKEYFRSGILYEFNELAKMPEVTGPKFVFAHVISPHGPFVFDENGQKVKAGDLYSFNKALYLGQYIFITKKVKQLVEDILSKSEKPPVIIIQSDHSSNSNLKYRNRIFNAIYFPGDAKKALYNNMSNKNTFRIVFNQYLGYSFPLLKD
ncbi:MAG: hypothetical protein A2252_04035 [Elusimicrobia bacterium RIFOXYA2_FULL_39_19]|nr:MAG: hypothetical protein A2252_04035 [Elusimicrobia bacterium RIFOXYA2_FULL_39_19]